MISTEYKLFLLPSWHWSCIPAILQHGGHKLLSPASWHNFQLPDTGIVHNTDLVWDLIIITKTFCHRPWYSLELYTIERAALRSRQPRFDKHLTGVWLFQVSTRLMYDILKGHWIWHYGNTQRFEACRQLSIKTSSHWRELDVPCSIL